MEHVLWPRRPTRRHPVRCGHSTRSTWCVVCASCVLPHRLTCWRCGKAPTPVARFERPGAARTPGRRESTFPRFSVGVSTRTVRPSVAPDAAPDGLARGVPQPGSHGVRLRHTASCYVSGLATRGCCYPGVLLCGATLSHLSSACQPLVWWGCCGAGGALHGGYLWRGCCHTVRCAEGLVPVPCAACGVVRHLCGAPYGAGCVAGVVSPHWQAWQALVKRLCGLRWSGVQRTRRVGPAPRGRPPRRPRARNLG